MSPAVKSPAKREVIEIAFRVGAAVRVLTEDVVGTDVFEVVMDVGVAVVLQESKDNIITDARMRLKQHNATLRRLNFIR